MGTKKRTYFGWAIGSFTTSALVSAVGLLHLRFITDSIGISIGIAGAIAVLAKIYDAGTDPLMGIISDRTRTRFGQFRPYILAGGLLSGLSMILLFNVPPAFSGLSLTIYITFTLLLYSTAYTIFRIPYLALGRSLTQDFEERSKLMTFSVYGSSLGSLAAISAAPYFLAVFGSDRAAHGNVALVLGAIIGLGGIATFLLIQESSDQETPRKELNLDFSKLLGTLKSNKPFLFLIAYKLTVFTGFGLHMVSLPYYTRHVLHSSDKILGSIFLTQAIAMMASQIMWVRLASLYGRRNTLIMATITMLIGMLLWMLVPTSQPSPWVQVIGAVSGIASGGVFLGLYTVLNDTMDYSRKEQGENRAGVLAGIFVMTEKATAALGIFVFSVILSYFGFISGTDTGATQQPADAILSLSFTLSILPATLAILSIVFIAKYRLPDRGQGI